MSAPMSDSGIERAIAAWVLAEPPHLAAAYGHGLVIDDVVDYRAGKALSAAANVHDRGEPVTLDAVRAELQREHDRRGPHRAGEERADLRWLDPIVQLQLDGEAPVKGWIAQIGRFAERRRERLAQRKYRSAVDVVDEIIARAAEPWGMVTLGGQEIVSVRPGGYVEVMGPTGSGKTSLVAGIAIEHARDRGPVAVMSRELPRDEFVARTIGMQCDASWADVLRGKVDRDEMRRRVAGLNRMLIADRRDANLVSLVAMIEELQLEHHGDLVMVVVDYAQIIEASRATDQRTRVIDVIAQIDDILRKYRCVGLLISQMSRASSRAARNGEAVGADSTDGGAESAAIERTATVTLSIGASGPQRDDGTRTVELSIGKGRMTGGDRVVPMSYDGRTGRWRIAGEARSGAEVKAERATKNTSKRVSTLVHAIPGILDASDEPLSRAAVRLAAGANDADTRAAVAELLTAAGSDPGDVVEVGKRERGAYRVWTRRRAVAAGLAIVPRHMTTEGP